MLSPRELQVLLFAADGLSCAETAERLGTSFHTVRTQRYDVLRKLQARNMVHALALAFTRGMITPSDANNVAPTSGSTPGPEPATIGP